jgi:hypothetical protein
MKVILATHEEKKDKQAIKGHVYKHRDLDDVHLMVTNPKLMKGTMMLVNLDTGHIWSSDEEFGINGPYDWEDVTDQYVVKPIED